MERLRTFLGNDIMTIIQGMFWTKDYYYLIGKWKDLSKPQLIFPYSSGDCPDLEYQIEGGHPEQYGYIDIRLNGDNGIILICCGCICEKCTRLRGVGERMIDVVTFSDAFSSFNELKARTSDDKYNDCFQEYTGELIFTINEFEDLLNGKFTVNLLTKTDIAIIKSNILVNEL